MPLLCDDHWMIANIEPIANRMTIFDSLNKAIASADSKLTRDLYNKFVYFFLSYGLIRVGFTALRDGPAYTQTNDEDCGVYCCLYIKDQIPSSTFVMQNSKQALDVRRYICQTIFTQREADRNKKNSILTLSSPNNREVLL